MPSYGTESKRKLATCHEDLQRVLNVVIKIFDVKINCGLRNEADQNQAVADKASYAEFPESRHNRSKNADGTWNYEVSDAVDVLPYPVKWPDMRSQTTLEYVKRIGAFYFMAGAVLAVAHVLGVKLKWGGHFKKFFDGPHFQRVTDE